MDGRKIRSDLFLRLGDPAQLLQLFNFLPTAFLYVKDRSGRFVAINDAQIKAKGLSEESDIWGKTDLDLHPAYWAMQYQEEDRRVMELGEPIPNQIWLVPIAGGRLGTFISSKIPLFDHSGVVVGLAGVMYRIDTDLESRLIVDAVETAIQHIADHYQQDITVASIAAAVELSTSQLNRRFRQRFSSGPSEYLQRVRVTQAARLLSETDLSATQIALQCGFYDSAHFSRTFRKFLGCTATKFRRQNISSSTDWTSVL